MKVDYKNNIINITNSILKHYGLETYHNTFPLVDKYLRNNYNHLVVILIDGLGVNVINEHLNDSNIFKNQLKTSVSTVFPPTTVAATNAFLVGKTPYETGFLGWNQYNEEKDITETIFLKENADTFEKSENNLYDKLLENSFIYQIGNKYSNIHTEEVFIKPINNSHLESFKEQLDRTLMNTLNEKSVTYVYYQTLDAIIHEVGYDNLRVKEHLLKLEEVYSTFLKEIKDDVLVITTADHGFTNIENIDIYNYLDIKKCLKRRPSIEGRAMTFFIKEGKEKEFKQLFNNYFKDYFILYDKNEIMNKEIFGYGLKHPLFDSFIGDYLAVSKSNKAFCLGDDNFMKAHHGGGLKIEFEVPLIINKKMI